MEVAASPARAHLHVLVSAELMQFLKDTVYLRSRGGERVTQQDLVNEILEGYYREHSRSQLLIARTCDEGFSRGCMR